MTNSTNGTGWSHIFDQMTKSTPHVTLKRNLASLSEKRGGRNVIAYYSGFMQKPAVSGTEIDSNDKHAFMAVIHKLDCGKGLDLILHTPGGEVYATHSLIYYLQEMFGKDIEVFVPQMAMSGGTVIACASKTIHMGKPSVLGPIDPQIFTPWGYEPVTGILSGWKRAKDAIKGGDPEAALWANIAAKYSMSIIISCENALRWSVDTTKYLLLEGMFGETDRKVAEKTVDNIVEQLSTNESTIDHSRQLTLNDVEASGLVVSKLEDTQDIQDLVLDTHHVCMYLLGGSPSLKLIVNQQGVCLEKQPTNFPMPQA